MIIAAAKMHYMLVLLISISQGIGQGLDLCGGSFWYTFVVPVFQGFDLCDIHGKRPHNPFFSVVPSKFRGFFFLVCNSHYLRLKGAFW